jgi:predicted MFS family arabinose efflux permease
MPRSQPLETTTNDGEAPAVSTRVPKPLVLLLSVSTAITVANLYYCQPLLGLFATAFGVSASAAAVVATLTQVGYALGLLFVVPLGDAVERKRLIVGLTVAAAAALAASGGAVSLPWLATASLATGFVSVAAQVILPFAAGLATSEERPRVVGTIMSGLLIGILCSRTVSGFIGAHFGWRAVYVGAALLMLLLACVLSAALTSQRPQVRISYGRLLGSLVPIVREEPVLRYHAILGALAFAAFSAFWSTIAFHVARFTGREASDVVGVFGLIGIVGALAASAVGRLIGRFGPRTLNGLSLGILLSSFVVLAVGGWSWPGLVAGVVLLDLGVQANHVTNQTQIFALRPEHRSRVNAAYMVAYFVGGAAGSMSGALVWGRFGWHGVSALGAAYCAVALLVFALRGSMVRGRELQARG